MSVGEAENGMLCASRNFGGDELTAHRGEKLMVGFSV